MRPQSPRGVGRLAWLVRRYAWLVFVCVLAFAGGPLVLGAAAPTYQADAIIIAPELKVPSRVLPQLGDMLFLSGGVKERVAKAAGVDAGNLVPDKLSVVIPKDSIVLEVQARDGDPQKAARLADIAADAFTRELNHAGAGVGQFAVQAGAIVPSEPLRGTSPLLLGVTGALAGLAVGIGLAALIGVLRRPVVTGRDVEEAVGVPLLGLVDVPLGRRGNLPGPVGVRGVASVARWMARLPADRLLLISPSSEGRIRQSIYVMTSVLIASLRPVTFRAPSGLIEAIEAHRAGLPAAPPPGVRTVPPPVGDPATADERMIVLVDAGTPQEIVDPRATKVSVVAIAPRGISRTRLRRLSDDYREAGLVGVILAEPYSTTWTGLPPRARLATPSSRIVATTVPEPERA